MRVEISIDGAWPDRRVFLGWAPVRAAAQLIDGDGQPQDIVVRNGGAIGGGKLVFDTRRWHDGADQLPLRLEGDGSPTFFWIAGEFGQPSKDYGDAAVVATAAGVEVGRRQLMVRIRKNAQTLTDAERDRFLVALAKLNAAGTGLFQTFREMHTDAADNEAHGGSGFLSWHRAYLLDLERELQTIDPTVALPYWRFDLPAPRLFDPSFLGGPPSNPFGGGMVDFPAGHPLEFWKTDTFSGVQRRPRFDTNTESAFVSSEQDTLLLGNAFGQFSQMEGDPHGYAHTSFAGFIRSPGTAPKDPLFFLLHNNVDRLWAKWQWLNHRFDPSDQATFEDGDRPGHRIGDTMWPWNGVTGDPRPPTAPGGPLRDSPQTARPGGSPKVEDLIDYQGAVAGLIDLGFDYDDVPFEAQEQN